MARGAHVDAARPPLSLGALAAVAGALVVLLAIAAAGAGGRRMRGSELTGLPPAALDYAYTLAVVAVLVLAVVAVAVLLGPWPTPAGERPRGLLSVLAMLAVVAGLSVLAISYADLARLGVTGEGRRPGAPPRVRPLDVPPELASARGPRFRWDAVAALALVTAAAGAVALARSRRRWPERREPPELAEAVSLVLDDTLDDLRSERDARRAVIAAYARLERTLAARGVPRRPAEAPLEYLARILLELEVEPEAVLDLTNLFEQAKFSRRRIDEGMKEEAIGALAAVRDDLRVAG